MMQCETCRFWQHTVCFGFQDGKDPKIPEVHRCFLCSGVSGKRLKVMEDLSLWRRALSVTFNERVYGCADLAKRLGVGLAQAKVVLQRMKEEELIFSGGKSKKESASHKKKAKTLFALYFSDKWEGTSYYQRKLGQVLAPVRPSPKSRPEPIAKKLPANSAEKLKLVASIPSSLFDFQVPERPLPPKRSRSREDTQNVQVVPTKPAILKEVSPSTWLRACPSINGLLV